MQERKREYKLLDKKVEAEIKRGIEIWRKTDTSPAILLNAALEELGEVAHALNHNEGIDSIQLEIAQTIGILTRLYEMVEKGKW